MNNEALPSKLAALGEEMEAIHFGEQDVLESQGAQPRGPIWNISGDKNGWNKFGKNMVDLKA
jgi:hypothetical protein